jgi:hypothetical protein
LLACLLAYLPACWLPAGYLHCSQIILINTQTHLAAEFEKHTAIRKPDAAGSVDIIDETKAKAPEATQSSWDKEVGDAVFQWKQSAACIKQVK